MPKPEKWADFTRTAVVSKQSKHGGAKMVDYAQFACRTTAASACASLRCIPGLKKAVVTSERV